MRIEGSVVLVTGGASGMGRASAQEFSRAGACIVLFDIDEQAAEKTARDIGPDVLPMGVDVSDHDAVSRAFKAIERELGTVNVCVNCAGVATSGKVVSSDGALPLADFRRAIEVNLIGTFDVMRQSAALMVGNEPDREGERGVIINVSSVAALQGQRGHVAYSASKAGVIGLTLPAARDLADHGIRVLTIAPGIFRTGMHAGLPEKITSRMESLTLYPHRAGDPAEFASLTRHVVENRYLNAATLPLDAGIRLI
ncbi:SDR family NAD(P)-dependent oxidoreductase [Phytoactinopolyspora endophytica]|uniref:SDR family NAD(P)-dependent oxidoreductase n=1 Tax=Phytoactinopolyspora endophytica TaxID=1642495 RepID=UPI00101C7068|nr:SDR family NAD(P)-dependent oxidoreductase [Phytoactinopolyspora endophytica]